MLEVTVAVFAYRYNRPQLRDVVLKLRPGRTVLLGPNGAGKTTLLKAIAGVVGYEGSMVVDGTNVPTSSRRPTEFHRLVGWLPQDVIPFPNLTAHEHVAYVGWLKGLSMKAAWAEAAHALDAVGLGAQARQNAGRLSGGQTRRLGIAGVLVHDAKYLLLDEPTAGLDPRERERLLDVLRQIEQDRAVLVSTHDTDSVMDGASCVHVLSEGRTQFDGSYSAFIAGHESLPPADRVRRAYAALVPED